VNTKAAIMFVKRLLCSLLCSVLRSIVITVFSFTEIYALVSYGTDTSLKIYQVLIG
jgi:hypothetical protein